MSEKHASSSAGSQLSQASTHTGTGRENLECFSILFAAGRVQVFDCVPWRTAPPLQEGAIYKGAAILKQDDTEVSSYCEVYVTPPTTGFAGTDIKSRFTVAVPSGSSERRLVSVKLAEPLEKAAPSTLQEVIRSVLSGRQS